jgi:hypothetical protein
MMELLHVVQYRIGRCDAEVQTQQTRRCEARLPEYSGESLSPPRANRKGQGDWAISPMRDGNMSTDSFW